MAESVPSVVNLTEKVGTFSDHWTPHVVGRRALMLGALAGMGAIASGPADACSIVPDPNVPFRDEACRAALQAWVDLLNAGPDMPLERLNHLVDEMSVAITDDDMITFAVGERNGTATETERNYLFYKNFRVSGGRSDPRPIRIAQVHLIRRLRNRATYQFTLERYSYHPADHEGCNGLFVHDEYYGIDRTSYLATFWLNRLRTVKPFPEWYLERVA